MAYQSDPKKKTGAKILRTPAPDIVDSIRSSAGLGYGQNGPQNRVFSNPGTRTISPLAANTEDLDVLQTIIKSGVAGRGDSIPVDGDTQLRKLELSNTPAAHGMSRQQCDLADIPKSLPTKLGANVGKPVRQP
jgi:hypothetical protein